MLFFAEEPEIDLDVVLKTSIVAKAGQDVQIMIPFKGRPPPTVVWRKGDKNLSVDERYTIQNTESSTLLSIPQVTRNDTGKYTLTIENGVGKAKTSFVNVKVLDTPSACQRLHLKNVSRGTVTLVWEPPLINGGSEVTNYVIEKRDATKRAWSSVTAKCSNTSFKITDLSEKIPYFFRVLAENENGLGEPCETLEPVKAAEVPGPVRDLTMKDSTKTSVILQWTKPEFDGGSIISEYVIEKRLKDETEWSYAGISKACEFEVEKLKELSVMDFKVSAKNEKGRSDGVTIGPITVKDYIITPEADLSDIPGGQITVRIGYNVHLELPYKGKPIPSMSWLKDNMPLKESELVRFKKTENKITLSIKNVKKENGGKYTLILDNVVHRKSFPFTVITLGPPSKPKGPIKLDEIKADSMILSWNPPEDDGGGEITGYSVEKRETSQTNWKMICSSVSRTTFKVPNLVKDVEYQFRIRAENRYGVSPPLNSVEVIAKHQFKPPGSPGKPVVYNITADGMTISWDAPLYDGGAEITGYHVEKKEKNSILWQKVNISPISSREYRIIGLMDGLDYQFRVYAENSAGISPASDPSKLHLAVSPPAGIVLLITVNTFYFHSDPPETITLKWTAPMRDGGSKIAGYSVEKRQGPEDRWVRCNFIDVSECQYTVTGLNPGDRYEFRILARNAVVILIPLYGTPIFLKHFEGLTVKAGESIRLKALITGRPVPQVTWSKDGEEIDKRLGVEITTDIGYSTIFVRDASRDHRGIYRVEAKNSSGTRQADITIRVQDTPGKIGGPPTVVKVIDTSKTSVTLEWTTPVFDGGLEIIGYIIEMCKADLGDWHKVNAETLIATKYTVTDLEPNEHYKFRVSAVNTAGKGESCEVAASVQTVDRLSSPELDIDASFKQTHIVRAGTNIRLFIAFKGRPVPIATWSKADSDLNLQGLEYQFRTYALNAAGVSKASEASRPVVAQNPVGKYNTEKV
uniref:Titin n=1 Tax=Pseudonaja textilis TaxID=8673 RepID=A0A670Y1P8_PSETE